MALNDTKIILQELKKLYLYYQDRSGTKVSLFTSSLKKVSFIGFILFKNIVCMIRKK